jgi:hypothetical protein
LIYWVLELYADSLCGALVMKNDVTYLKEHSKP